MRISLYLLFIENYLQQSQLDQKLISNYNYNKLYSMKESREDQILTEIQAIKKQINVNSTELQNQLKFMHQNVFKRTSFSFCGTPVATSSPQFCRAFNTLNGYEKAEYYLSYLKIIKEINKNKQKKEPPSEEQQRFQVLFRDDHRNRQWRNTFIVINYKEQTIFVESTEELLNLKHYLFRISKCKDRSAFVLQSNYPNTKPLSLRLSSESQQILQDIKLKIQKIILFNIRQSIHRLMGRKKQGQLDTIKRKSIKQQFRSQSIMNSKINSANQFIQQGQSKIYISQEQYYKIMNQLQIQIIISQLDNFDGYEEVKKGIFFNNQKPRVRKVFEFQQATTQQLAIRLFDFQNFKKWKNSLFVITLLANLVSQDTKIFHEVDMYKDSTQSDFLYLRHKFMQDNLIYFIDKSITTIEYSPNQALNNRGIIEYCAWRLKKVKGNTVQLIVQCEMSHVSCLDIYEVISQQIGQIGNILKYHKSSKKLKQTAIKSSFDFSTSIPIISQNQNNQFGQFNTQQQQHRLDAQQNNFYSISSKYQNKIGNNNKIQDEVWQLNTEKDYSSAKKYNYQTIPKPSPKQFQQFKGKQFFNPQESIINQKGQFIFVNAKKIQAQSNVLKSILKNIGSNLFQGKSILNTSLPIQIFGTDTNLQRLSRAMAYAPHFLENLVNATPLQRMKGAVGFSMGNILLYLEMTKPFNPVLGETYQGFIDGCPIYGQQISHHPPISSILMIGRGYFVSANLQAKVQFGFNTISGINEGYYNIAFNKTDPTKNVIKFTNPPGTLSGIIYGQRKLYLQKKTYFFDFDNFIYCQINWGKCKSQNSDSKFNDYLCGRIVKLKRIQINLEKIKESDIEEVLGHISGRWTERIYFNKQIIFDVNSIRPFRVTDQKFSLLSDSCHRQDMKLLGEGNIAQAQTAKQNIEQIQRRDRKLRKQYSK